MGNKWKTNFRCTFTKRVIKVDKTGSAEVWRGNLEEAELYHEQLFSKGLTMAPIEKI